MNQNIRKKKKRGIIIGLVSVIIALIIALLNYFLKQPAYLVLILGFIIASTGSIFGLYFHSKDEQEEINIENQHKLSLIQEAITKNIFQAEVLDKKTLYEKLSNSARSATSSLYLTSLKESNPRSIHEDYENDYHNVLEGLMDEGEISIRKIINIPTTEKLKWVDYLLNTYMFNSHLRFRYIDNPLKYQPLNLQIIDKKEVYIISPQIRSGLDDFSYQSLRFENDEIAGIFVNYYNQIWENCKDNILLEGGKINMQYFANKWPNLSRCYKMDEFDSEGSPQLQFAPFGKINEKSWSNIYNVIKSERALLSAGERELRRRYEDKKAAVVIHNDEIVSHSSIISLFSPRDCIKLFKYEKIDLELFEGFELFEFVGGWTKDKPEYRKKGLNKTLKNDLININTTINPKCVFIDCSRNIASAYMHLGMDWKILPWDKYPFVTTLIGYIEDGKFISRYGIMECGNASLYCKDEITIDTVGLYKKDEWDNFHFMVRNEEKVKKLNELITIYVNDIEKWKKMVKSELFYKTENNTKANKA